MGIGIIGCGAISNIYFKAFKQMRGVKIIAMAGRNVEKARELALEHGYSVEVYANEEDLLARDDIHVVCICTPSGLHGKAAVKAAKAKKHVIVEKPIEVTLEKIDQIIHACENNKVKLAAILNNRYREGHFFVKKAIAQGRLGKLINANAHIRWYRDPDYYLNSEWKGTWALDGGGVLMNQSIHYIDLLQWFIEDIESVHAYSGTLLHHNIESEDTVVAIFKSKSGILGTIVAGTSIYPGFAAKIEITGDRGSLSISDGILETWAFKDEDVLDVEAKTLMHTELDNKRASDPMAFDHTYHMKQLVTIIDAINNDKEVEVGGREARKSVEIILAIYKSAKYREEVIL